MAHTEFRTKIVPSAQKVGAGVLARVRGFVGEQYEAHRSRRAEAKRIAEEERRAFAQRRAAFDSARERFDVMAGDAFASYHPEFAGFPTDIGDNTDYFVRIVNDELLRIYRGWLEPASKASGFHVFFDDPEFGPDLEDAIYAAAIPYKNRAFDSVTKWPRLFSYDSRNGVVSAWWLYLEEVVDLKGFSHTQAMGSDSAEFYLQPPAPVRPPARF